MLKTKFSTFSRCLSLCSSCMHCSQKITLVTVGKATASEDSAQYVHCFHGFQVPSGDRHNCLFLLHRATDPIHHERVHGKACVARTSIAKCYSYLHLRPGECQFLEMCIEDLTCSLQLSSYVEKLY